jgi:hypothetical protein
MAAHIVQGNAEVILMNKVDWRNCPFLSLEMFICNVCYIMPLLVRNEILLRGRLGRAIAQAVSRRFPTAAAQVRAQVRSCGICGGQSGTGADLLQVLTFLLSILIPPTAPHL